MRFYTKEILLSVAMLTGSMSAMALNNASSANATLTNDYTAIHAWNDLIPHGTWSMDVSAVTRGDKKFTLTCDGTTTCPTEIADGQSIQLDMDQIAASMRANVPNAKNDLQQYDHIEIELTSPHFTDANKTYDYCTQTITYQVHAIEHATPITFAIDDMSAFDKYYPNLSFGRIRVDCYKNYDNAALAKYKSPSN